MSASKKDINICFVGNFYKTWVFHAVAQKLIKQGVAVSWIVSKQDQYDFLKQHYGSDQVLYVNRTFADKPNAPVDDFKLNELLFGDRVLRHELTKGLQFLTNIQKPMYDFLTANKPRFIIGEITWAHELLLQRMAKKRTELNCSYVQCSVIRIPNSRFAFFVDETEHSMLEFNEQGEPNEIIKLEKPKYLALVDDMMKHSFSLAGRWARLKRFFSGENIEKNDPNVVTNMFTRFRLAAREEINKTTYYSFIRTEGFPEIENEKFIFFGFHKQPENSIDVFGRYNEDQKVVVTNLWRLLPAGWKLVLKEHTNAVGDRSYSFYKDLLKYPNIILANEKINSKLLIEKSQLVVTVAGTMAYEAALMQKPAVTLAKVFFNGINYCRQVSWEKLVAYQSLTEVIADLQSQPDNRREFSNYLMRNSFPGYISDSFTDPTVMEDSNIEKIAFGFLRLIDRHG